MKSNNVWLPFIHTSVWQCGYVCLAEAQTQSGGQLTSYFPLYRNINRGSLTESTFSYESLSWHYKSYTSNRSIAPSHFPLFEILSSGVSLVWYNVKHRYTLSQTSHSSRKWSLSLRGAHITSSRVTLGWPVILILEVQAKVANLSWRWPTTAWICFQNNWCVFPPTTFCGLWRCAG